MHGEQSLLRGLVDSGRKVLAGLLFMLPGVLSDGFALMLLMLPINRGRYGPEPAVAGRTHVRRRTTIDGISADSTDGPLARCSRRYLSRSSSVGSSLPARR